MAQVLRLLPPSADPNVLVGIETADDAGVYRLNDDVALVQSVDFFTPVVDDPLTFGHIAAANSLSDLYAMGATPLCALNIVAYPMEKLGPEVLAQILAGGATVTREAGVAIIGGHTVEDDEPKYGLAVTGTVHPQHIVTNAGAKPGDLVFLTKAIGTGILASALKKDAISEHDMAPAIASMVTLNSAAAQAMLRIGVDAATDVTGFGILGHAGEMARASRVRLRITASRVPLFPRVLDLIAVDVMPGGTKKNAREHAAFTEFGRGVPEGMRLALSDAQTSGGLLIAVPA
ncbi:MAG: selenide, water dikinase SelD, partial [Candidatus Eremiobacteraeota bacterium]|nr:selenide, water dikinase SelD [Candidatus Eremiobacteraeota bacterium]